LDDVFVLNFSVRIFFIWIKSSRKWCGNACLECQKNCIEDY